MEKIISDEELNALLSETMKSDKTIQNGVFNTTNKEVKNYDYKNPKIFLGEHVKTMDLVHRDFGNSLSAAFSLYFDLPVQIVFGSIKEQKCGEYFTAVPKPVLLCTMEFQPFHTYCLIEIHNGLALSMVDRLLGGEGKVAKDRALTDIEIALVRKALNKLSETISISWQRKVKNMHCEIDTIVTDLEKLHSEQFESKSQNVFIINFEMKFGLNLGNLNICLPHLSLKPFISELGSSSANSSNIEIKGEHVTEDVLQPVSLSMKTYMGNTPITIADFIKLQKGDVIPIIKHNEFITLKIENKVELYGRLGRIKNKKAIKIVKVNVLEV